ncbi:LLM class flavin-dependent oxidoreductase [uncultured Leifsonia sp.]|uniref:LLM class flavin-dependent oxidoreductase n=1 Tax=uncultured Leifsonia sp. TaxID=340359 RepID=UPI0028D040FC|nr:LLM class flavin-dependent oxidoreductase [uncultured Leifsonia sp.]
MAIELGVFGFGELASYPARRENASNVTKGLRELGDLAEMADRVGLDVFGLGEHHREEFAVSAPAVVLASLAERTSRIRLASVLTVLAADDPVRVLEQFATVDALSYGRVDLMVGRDAFPEAFSLFGHRLTDDDWLFDEKLRLLLQLRQQHHVTWAGESRPALHEARIVPRPVGRLPIGVTTGRTTKPVELAGELGLPLSLLMQAGSWESYRPLAELYRQSFRVPDTGPARPTLSVLVPGHIAVTATKARQDAGGLAPRPDPTLPATAIIGDPSDAVDQLVRLHDVLQPQRVLVSLGRGRISHSDALKSVELFGKEVAPAVREIIAQREAVNPA